MRNIDFKRINQRRVRRIPSVEVCGIFASMDKPEELNHVVEPRKITLDTVNNSMALGKVSSVARELVAKLKCHLNHKFSDAARSTLASGTNSEQPDTVILGRASQN